MKLHQFNYECLNCGNTFLSPQLIGDCYGEFLLRSITGKISFFQAIDNQPFKDCSDMIKKNKKTQMFSITKRSQILHNIFYIACDPAEDGSEFSITQMPICSLCGQANIGHWGPTTPPIFIDLEVPTVTHNNWNRLDSKQKEVLLEQAITNYFSE